MGIRRLILLLFIAIAATVVSCRPPDDNKAEPAPYSDYRFPDIIYDTSTISGLFIVGTQYRNATDTGWYVYAKYLKKQVKIPKYTIYDTALLYLVPGYETAEGVVGTGGIYNAIYSKWSFEDSGSVTFTDSMHQPNLIVTIPDTILRSGSTLYIANISNADAILLSGYESIHDYPSDFHIVYSVNTDSIYVDSTVLGSSYAGSKVLTLLALRHQYQTINGATYLFIKQTAIQKAVFVK